MEVGGSVYLCICVYVCVSVCICVRLCACMRMRVFNSDRVRESIHLKESVSQSDFSIEHHRPTEEMLQSLSPLPWGTREGFLSLSLSFSLSPPLLFERSCFHNDILSLSFTLSPPPPLSLMWGPLPIWMGRAKCFYWTASLFD